MGLTDIDTLPGILADTVADLESGMDLVFAYIEAVDAAGHKYGPGADVLGTPLWLAPGLVKLLPAVAYHFCLNLPEGEPSIRSTDLGLHLRL